MRTMKTIITKYMTKIIKFYIKTIMRRRINCQRMKTRKIYQKVSLSTFQNHLIITIVESASTVFHQKMLFISILSNV